MNIKRFFLVCTLALSSTVMMAQSAAEIELAKQLARQQGYSDAQINAMLEKKNSTESVHSTGTVNRNSAAIQQQQMMQQQQMQMQMNYGVAGQAGVIPQQPEPVQEPMQVPGPEPVQGQQLPVWGQAAGRA